MKRIPVTKSSAKTVVLSVLTAVLVLGCEKSPFGEGRTVGFSVACDETKAPVTTTTSINAAGNKFLVDLIDVTAGSPDRLAVVKKSELVTCSDDNKTWTMADVIYWDAERSDGVWAARTLDAWSRYPSRLNGGSMSVPTAWSEEGAEQVSYNDGNVAQLAADRTALKFNFATYCGKKDASEKQDDLLFAYSGDCKGTVNDGKIPVHFYHALSAVYFKFGDAKVGQTIESGSNVKVDSIKISGIKRAGTCTYTPGASDGSDVSSMFAWDTSAGELDRNIGSYVQDYNHQTVTPGDLLGGGTFENGKTFFVIPQAMTEDAEITVYWTKNGEPKMARTAGIHTTTDKDGNPYNVVWKAGYKYLYTIRILNNGSSLDLSLDVLPWNQTSESIDYSDVVSVSDGGGLSFSQCDVNAALKRYAVKNGLPVIAAFHLGSPAGGSWLAGLSDYSYFDVSPASGPINDESAVVYIIPKDGVDRSVEHTVKLRISARRVDGRTISADEVLSTDEYTIVLPKAE